MERKAPKEVNYQDILPLALPSSSNRREFMPNNGQTFSPTGTNIIRIDVNADSMLDASHSYLRVKLKNIGTATHHLSPDNGCPFIQRLRIESGGTTLEDIYGYNRLYNMLEYAQTSPDNFQSENSLNLNQNQAISYLGTGAATVPTWGDPIFNMTNYNCHTIPGGGVLVAGGAAESDSMVYCIPLVSAIFNCEKYIPLILMNAGITIEITLAPGAEIGTWTLPAVGGAGSTSTAYQLSNVAYCAHLVDMDRSFYDALRGEMALSGSIAIHGQTWKHYSANIAAGDSTPTINIPARAKSIKSIFSTFRKSSSSIDSATENARYSTGVLQRNNISSWGYKIGSVNYPQSKINVSENNIAPTLCEVLKAFGKLGDTSTSSCLSKTNFRLANDGDATSEPNPDNRVQNFLIAYDCEGFQKSNLESGVNTSERALAISLELTYAVVNAYAITNDNYVCCDAFFYINGDGTLTPSS
tara:strand:- start:3133 stop:4542 length:1410 start_codon:yes stop_codon:yes gene_type:complete